MMNKEDNLKEQFIKTNEIEKGIVESAGDSRERWTRKYERGPLLKLRLHPLSLQKPKELPNIDIIKSKAHFQHISEDLNRTNIQHVLSHALSSGWLPPVMRSEGYRRILPHSPSTPAFLNRVYPYHSSSRLQKKNSLSPSFSNCGPSFTTPIHVSQPNQSSRYPSTTLDNIWNCYRGYSSTQEQSRKDCRVSVPRSKKMIEIIDPHTGKNILEIVSPASPEETRSTASEASTSFPEQEHKVDCSFESKKSEEHCSIIQTDDLKTIQVQNMGNGDASESAMTNRSCDSELCESLHGQCSTDFNCPSIVPITSAGDENKRPFPKFCKCKKAEGEPSTKQFFDDKEYQTVDSHEQAENNHTANYGAVDAKEWHDSTNTEDTSSPSENSDKDVSDNLKKQIERDAKLLKDNMYVLKKEQQQIGMLKSFLLSKQRQLEETACLLEDKKMEMADLELFLMSKERRLRRKEYVLGARESMLQNVEKKQEEKEQQLRIMKAYLENPEGTRKEASSMTQNAVDGTEDKDKGCAVCHKRSEETERLEERSNDLHRKIFSDRVSTSEPESLTNDKDGDLACISKSQSFKELGESEETAPSSNASQTFPRKYFPLDIQLWMEKKEKMFKDKCACQKDSKLIEESNILSVDEKSR